MAARQGVNGAVGPFDDYCDGYGNPGAQGLGYISVLKLATGIVNVSQHPMDSVLSGIVAYDRAEANTAYIGQINMVTASSFCGLKGMVWGYDLCVAESLRSKPIMNDKKRHDGAPYPVYDAQPLLDAGVSLFGMENQRRFPPIPGGRVMCANKSATASYSDRFEGKHPTAVWCYIAVSIAEDREKSADLFIEDALPFYDSSDPKDVEEFLKKHTDAVVDSILLCGKDQNVRYKESFISWAYTMIEDGYVGTALTCVPYIILAQNAVASQGFEAMKKMGISEWEKDRNMQPLPAKQ